MSTCQVGDALPSLTIPITTTLIVSAAIATRDFQKVHHDRDVAKGAGTKDVFMNILTTNGLVSRYVTDWAGPEAEIKGIDIRLGAPCFPGDEMVFSGIVESIDDGRAKVAVRGQNSLGTHVSGVVDLICDRREGGAA